VLSRGALLQELAEACGGDAGGLLAAVDAAGRGWLDALLARLPAGAAVVSVSAAAAAGDGKARLRVCRLEGGGAPPLMVVLPPPESGLARWVVVSRLRR
jgi:hypothetical protein